MTTLTLELTSMAPSGEAIGRHAGLVIFVPFGLPGEQVLVRLTQQKKNFARAELVQVLRASPERIAPRCAHFGPCGGCSWQHINYPAQVAYKTQIVCEQLTRIGKLVDPPVQPCLPSPQPYSYRNHARLQRSPGGRLGYHAAGTQRVVEITECPILEDSLQKELHNPHHTNHKLEEQELRVPMQPIRLGNYDYTVSPLAFFQVNTAVAALLVQQVMMQLALGGGERVLDLYCGVGLFTLPMAAQAAHVTGVEFNATATADAQINRIAAQLKNVLIITAGVEDALHRPTIQQQHWDAIVLDPPRAGVDAPTLQQIIKLAVSKTVPKIVYVSCDPATLARDARVLHDNGYALHTAQPLDMFPQTPHVETVATFLL